MNNHHDEPRDLSKFRCPQCGIQASCSGNRTCGNCGYRGDWIQPGETELYRSITEMLNGFEARTDDEELKVLIAATRDLVTDDTSHLDNPAYCAPTDDQ